MKALRLCALFWILSVGLASAQNLQEGIIVNGEGRVAAPPDMASITLGVSENAETAGAVMEKVNTSVAAILKKLDALGIAPQDRQTAGFYLQPVHNHDQSNNNAPPRITGYRAGNTVNIRVRDLDNLGAVMDGVIATGANNFNGLRFSLQDDSEALVQARERAVADAMLRATQLAEAAGLTLGAVLRMSETSHQGQPAPMGMARASFGTGEAIAGGEVDITARVEMVFSIAPGGQ